MLDFEWSEDQSAINKVPKDAQSIVLIVKQAQLYSYLMHYVDVSIQWTIEPVDLFYLRKLLSFSSTSYFFWAVLYLEQEYVIVRTRAEQYYRKCLYER